MAVYTTPDQYAGKSLWEIRNLTNEAFQPGILGEKIGVGEKTPLQAGQTFTTSWTDPGSAEYQALQKLFNPTSEADYYSKQASDQMQKALAPAISALEASKPIAQQLYGQQADFLQKTSTNIDQRYQNILDSLTNKEAQDKAQVGLTTSREFGKRGVPISSGAYDVAYNEKTLPISQNYATLAKDTGIAREADLMQIAQKLASNPIELAQTLNQIQQAIATVQTGGAKDAITNAFNQQNLAQNLIQSREELANRLKIAEMEKTVSNNDPLGLG